MSVMTLTLILTHIDTYPTSTVTLMLSNTDTQSH